MPGDGSEEGKWGQVSWIETKGTTDKRGINGPDPFSAVTPFLHIGDCPATRLDWEADVNYRTTNFWSTRCYFMAVRDTFMCLNMGSPDPTRDRELYYDEIANSFDVIENCVGIVFVRDDETPASFVTGLLEEAFDYRHDQATQRLVRINAQRESVVALVDASEADVVVQTLNERSKAAGHSLTCRVAS